MQQVRAKFTVQSLAKQGSSTVVRLGPQYDESIPEDQRYAKATPSGEVSLTIDNPTAAEFFRQGQAYYLDFTLADASKARSAG